MYRQYQRPQSDFFGGMAVLALLVCVIGVSPPSWRWRLRGAAFQFPRRS